MKNLEEILKTWETDADIDQTEPGRELLKIPKLHSKYLNVLINHKVSAKKAHFDYLRMRKIKWEYYTGKMSKEELDEHGWQPFQFTLKSDINLYLESDNDLIRLLEKKMYHDETVIVIEAIMKELNSRTYQLRAFIDFEKFVSGM